jgi:hypothetical protein
MDAIEATPDGIRLSQWVAGAPVSRATAYQLLKVLGIETEKVPIHGSRAPVAVLNNQQVAAMDAAAARIASGTPLSAIAAAMVPRQSADGPWAPAEPSADDPQTPLSLPERLEAIERAQRTGAPLTTAEVGLLIGARPGGDVVTRGRLTVRRQSRNVWTLDPPGL